MSSNIQTNFTSGEFSPFLEGHINLEKRQGALSLCQNMICLKQGPVVRRGGTRFVKEVKDSSKRTALVPFEYSTEQAYIIEFGDTYLRFYRNNSVITATAQNITNITQANPAVLTYSGSDTYANGDQVYISGVVGMTQVNGKFFTVANVNAGANTFELSGINSTGYSAYTSGGTVAEVYEITGPYPQADLFDSNNLLNFQYAQSADVLFMAHGSYAPRTLTRTGHASWTLATLTLNDGPYLDLNTTATTLTLSGTSGSVTVTASATTGINGGSGFASTDVGRLIRWRDPANNWTWLTITAFTSTTQVTATISGPNASAGTATTNWRLGVYSDTTGWPKALTFHQGRLVLAGCRSYPDRIDFTKTGGYSATALEFAPSNAAGTVADDNAIAITLQSNRVNAIQWLSSDSRGLLAGTTGQEWIVRSSETNDVLTPSNAKADPFSKTGSAYIQPVQADTGSIFVQRARRKIFDVIYSFEQDTQKPRDITITAEHITKNQIIGMAYQQEPVNVIWSVRGDGVLLGMTYYPDQNVAAWNRHIIGGAYDTGDAVVESIAVIPAPDLARDELWLIVKRTINGSTKRYIEYMTRYYEDDIALEDAVQVDCSLTYDGAATATITGIDHLEGQTVRVMADGKSHPDLTVASGSVTLANSRTASVIQIGLSNRWKIQTMQLEGGSPDQSIAQGKTKRITGFVLRLLNSLGLSYGTNDSNLEEYTFNQGADYDETVALYSGDTDYLLWPDGYETTGKMYFTDDGVFPMTILAVMPTFSVYPR